MVDTILIVDDEPAHLRMADYVIQHKLRYHTVALPSGEEALAWITSGKQPVPDLLLLDLVMPGMPGLEVISEVKAWNPQLPVIVVTPYGDHEHVPAAIQAGANDFLAKPIVIDRLALSLQNALKIRRLSHYIAKLEHNTAGQISLSDVLSDCPAMKQAVAQAGQAASADMPVWIEGEHGTGKELFARAIHGSGRAKQPFMLVDCTLLKEQAASLNKETFFAEKCKEAMAGSIFFKEINRLDAAAQQSLLHVLEQMKGGARVICSSSESMEYAVQQGHFSQRLHRQLKGLAIGLPTLRERKGDIVLLAEYFLMMAALAENRAVYAIAPRALNWLQQQAWPDNIRQLSGLIRQAVLRSTQDTLDIEDFQPAKKEPLRLAQALRPGNGAGADNKLFLDGQGQLKKLKHIESEAIRFALHYSGGCMTRAAKSLGIGRSTLYRKMGELDDAAYISRANQTMRPII